MANEKYNFAFPTVSPNTTYAGELALPYLAPVTSANSIVNGYMTSLAGVRNKAVVSSLTSADPIVGSACTVTNGDNLTLGESVLTTTDVMVNESICRGTLYPTWVAQQMNGNRNGEPTDFIDFAAATVAGKAAEQVESMLYKGSTTLGTGLISNDGTIDNDGIQAGQLYLAANYVDLGAALSKANIEAKFEAVYNKAVAVAAGILNKEDNQILVSAKTYGIYMQFLSGVLGVGGYDNKGTNQSYGELTYLGVPVRMAYGMPDDAIIMARVSNLFVGTNLGTDATEVNIIPRYQYDGSDFIQLVMRFGIGVQVGIKADCILAVNQTIS
tara:strand:+ start:118 stop:1098 length:981 start_codon:yes stop_codon:yes gene_type:complete